MSSPISLPRVIGVLHKLQCDVSRSGDRLDVTLPAWDFGFDTFIPDPLRDRLELSICTRGKLMSRIVYGNPAQISLHAAITSMLLVLAFSSNPSQILGWRDAFALGLIANSIPFALSWLNAEMLRRKILRVIRL